MDILQLVIVGMVVGSIIGLGAMGLTLTFGVLKFANFAHADLMTLGMYLAFFVIVDIGIVGAHVGPFSFGWGMIPAVLFAWGGVAAFTVGVDRFVFRPLRRRETDFLSIGIASLGVAIALQAVVQAIWGSAPLRYHSEIHRALTFAGGLKIKPDQILIIGLTLAMAVGLYLLLHRTRLGTAMRATSDNAPLAEASGIDTERVRIATWVIASAMTTVAGVMFALQSQLRFDAGFEFLLLPMFAAVILGGIGNPWGALVGGLIVGISQELSTEWINTGFKPGVPFLLLILILIVRPRGLFGSETQWST
ncbi:MAG: branched-chain amino acid ABC transporter permease [Chloroflexota bacterium]|nr:branched-chain amino acid ABC transporter permease [Chloroflexota bacterium]